MAIYKGTTIISGAQDVSDAVHRTGNKTETIDGRKIFTTNAPVRKMGTEIDGNAHYNVGYEMQDKNGTTHGYFRTVYYANNNVSCGVQATRKVTKDGETKDVYSQVEAVIKPDGTTYATAPTPAAASNDTSIATTAWVKANTITPPNYSAGQDLAVSTTHTATKNGWVFWWCQNTTQGQFYVNNMLMGDAIGWANKWADCNSLMVPVSTGDTYRCTGRTAFKFFPCK